MIYPTHRRTQLLIIIIIIFLLLLLILSSFNRNPKPNNKKYLLRIYTSHEHSHTIEKIVTDVLGHGDLWIVAIATPKQYEYIRSLNIPVVIISKDVDRYVNKIKRIEYSNLRTDDFFAQYHSYDEIITYLKTIPTYTEMGGKSVEGRALPVVTFGSSSAPHAIYIQGNIHAREWITNASLLVAIDKLNKAYNQSTQAQKVQLYIAPMINPDGYEYSRTKTRLWRGNRNTKTCNQGVDLNRNFNGFNSWKNSKCGETYGGDKATSEPETRAVMAFVQNILKTQKIIAAIDFHSFSQWIMHPPGYEGSSLLPTDNILRAAGNALKDSVKKEHNITYKESNSKEMYPANGACDDWLYDIITKGADRNQSNAIAFTIELPPSGDSANIGFVLPPTQIQPVGAQVYTFIQTLVDHCLALNKI